MYRRRGRRNQSGLLGALMLAGVILMVCALGAIALDVAHVVTVKTELQSAVDAAALSGAQELSRDPNNAEYQALAVAADNTADGKPVTNEIEDATITVLVTPAAGNDPGSVQVDARMRLKNMLAPIFGRNNEVVTASSIAGGTGIVTGVRTNKAFPLAVSLDAVPESNSIQGVPLYRRHVGETFDLYVNSQQVKNAAFTSLTDKNTNADWLKSAIDQSIGLAEKETGFIPSVNVGDDIYLDNGVASQKHLADDVKLAALLDQEILILPVIKGTPPFNQSQQCVGFIAIKVTNVEVNSKGGEVETITCQLLKTSISATTGSLPGTGSEAMDSALAELAPSGLKLLPTTM